MICNYVVFFSGASVRALPHWVLFRGGTEGEEGEEEEGGEKEQEDRGRVTLNSFSKRNCTMALFSPDAAHHDLTQSKHRPVLHFFNNPAFSPGAAHHQLFSA